MTSAEPNPESIVDIGGAAEILEVEPGRIKAMVEEGLLHPLPGRPEPAFDLAEVRAVHNLGG